MESKCPHCLGYGWVCEFHMDKPWEGTAVTGACDCGGAGCNCICNMNGDPRGVFDAVYASTDPDNVKNWVQ